MEPQIYQGVGAQPYPVGAGSKFTEYDYEYLTGTWEGIRGAAFNVVAEWCQNHGYGYYGEPTEKGKLAIKDYEAVT